MKKFLSLALSVLMLLSLLAGCGGGSSTDDGAQQDGGSETAETGGKLVVYSRAERGQHHCDGGAV